MMMFESKEKKAPLPWWFESHNNSKRSRWLHSTLSELDQKTIAMLKLIEEDADSFAQRAEMYYKKRPELINMVEDFYRAHRSLAERLDMLKSEPRTRMMTPLSSPVSAKSQLSKLMSMEKSYDSYSDTYSESGESEVDDPEQDEETQVDSKKSEDEDSADSEVDDPEQDEETQLDSKKSEDEDSADSEVDNPEQEEVQVHRLEKGAVDMVSEIEVMKLRDEIERLKEENKIQKEQLMQKDEEKREVIRQLTLSMEILKENTSFYKSRTAKESNMRSTAKEPSKKWGPFEFNKVKGLFSVKLFNASSKIQT